MPTRAAKKTTGSRILEKAMTRMKFGYVGVGLMGLPMTKRLVECGHTVTVYDIDKARIDAAVAVGAKAADSASATTTGADAVLLNLPTTEAVEAAMFGPTGAARSLEPPQIVVDFSTIRIDKGRAFAEKLAERTSCRWIDAPVSGGPPASGDGTLTIMAGGEAEDIARLQPLFSDIAARVTHVGPAGSGLVVKMINQLIVGCGHAVMAEALVLAEAAGIDATRVPECLAGGHADGTLLQKLYPRMQARDFTPQGYARQLLKDLEMVNELCAGLKTPTPMMNEALSLYRMAIHRGFSELDTSAVFKLYEK
jgi:3-hydroxyisobutyrate dehydrogenase-like beta-hydroxyacid dehydrogenase